MNASFTGLINIFLYLRAKFKIVLKSQNLKMCWPAKIQKVPEWRSHACAF
jgi:hypothetical protein